MSQSEDNTEDRYVDKSLFKREVDVELILHDGTHLTGSVYVPAATAPHNIFVALPDFFHLHRETTDYYLINKSYVAICKIPPVTD